MIPNFCQALYDTLRQQPDATWLDWPGPGAGTTSTSGRELLDALSAFRQQLAQAGVAPGQRVLLLAPFGPALVGALLGTMAAGAVPVLPPAGASAWRLLRLMRRQQPAAVVGPPALTARWGWLLRRLGRRVLVLPAAPAAPQASWPAPVPVPPHQAALLSYTSGSTGAPKAIGRSHLVLTAQHQVLKAQFPPWPGQYDFPLFPNILLHNLSVGTRSLLPALDQGLARFDAARVAAQLRQNGPDTLTGNVHYFRRLLPQLLAAPVPGVRAVGVGGSPVPEWLLQQLGRTFPQARVVAIYGSSEAEPIALRPVAAALNPALGYCVGEVVAGLECRLQPLGALQLPDGRTVATGEVCVRGAHVAAPDWLQTGDFGYFDEQNRLWLTGRRGNAAICRGVQHYQVEHTLQHVPGVEQVAARARGSHFAVWVQGEPTAAALQAALAAFPPGLVTQLHFRHRLPLDARHLSKIRYEKLR